MKRWKERSLEVPEFHCGEGVATEFKWAWDLGYVVIVCDAEGCGEEIASGEPYFVASEQNVTGGKAPRTLHFHSRHVEGKVKIAKEA